MVKRITASSVALTGVLLGFGWHFLAPSPNAPAAPSERTPHAPAYAAQGTTPSVFGRASFGHQSPFVVIRSPLANPGLTVHEHERPRKQFEQLLQDYRSGELSPERKIRIKEALRELTRDPFGRALIIDTFVSTNAPQLAESLYGLIRDADLKDVTLLEGLIQRDSAKPGASAKARIVDLIADLPAQKDAPYSAAIDGYLAQVAMNPDSELRSTAASQRIWYLAQHQPHNLAALQKYLLDQAPTVREEMYSLIESRMANQTLSGQTELALALNTAVHAEYLGLSAEEKARAAVLLESLIGSGAPF
jgi:hypothetical protein